MHQETRRPFYLPVGGRRYPFSRSAPDRTGGAIDSLNMKATAKSAPQLVNPVDWVMQAARQRCCPIAPLTAAVTKAVCAELQCGKVRAAAALRLHRQWESLLRRHLLAIGAIRLGGENLLKLEEEILSFAESRGLIARAPR
jgi:hypothetical protein